MLRTLENLKGKGRLTGAALDTAVAYDLEVVQEQMPNETLTSGAEAILGTKSINAKLRFVDPDSEQMPPVGEAVTLVLADGRSLSLFYIGNGQFQATGDFF